MMKSHVALTDVSLCVALLDGLMRKELKQDGVGEGPADLASVVRPGI
jgi:hypothetical protein